MITRRAVLTWLACSAETAFRQGVSSRSVKPQPRGKPSGRPFAARFTDVAAPAGLTQPTVYGGIDRKSYIIEVVGCGVAFLDYDNDGWLDLFVANGAVNVLESQRGQPVPFRMKDQLFHNASGRFDDTSAAGGPAFAQLGVDRGAAFGDIDNDGDIDIVVTSNNGPVKLLLNQAPHGGGANHWLQIRLDQPSRNRFAFGAWVGVERSGKPTLWRRVRTDGSYLSASDSRLHFGLGASTSVSGISVQWPDGQKEHFPAAAAVDRLITLHRGSASR